MSAQGGERFAADGGTWVLRFGSNSWGPFAQAGLRSGQGRTWAVSGFAVISDAWEKTVHKESRGLLHFHLPPSRLLSPETLVGDGIGGQSASRLKGVSVCREGRIILKETYFELPEGFAEG